MLKRDSNLAAYIRALMKEGGIKSARQLAEKAKITPQGLNKILRGETQGISLEIAKKLGKALNQHPMNFISLAPGMIDMLPIQHEEKYALAGVVGVYHLNFPDGSILGVGQDFTKTWLIENHTRQDWLGCRFLSLDNGVIPMFSQNGIEIPIIPALLAKQSAVELGTIHAGACATVSIDFQTPYFPGNYLSHWRLLDESGQNCFPDIYSISCRIEVMELLELPSKTQKNQ
jgi:DNA-binding Xre family transcriptional regulator